MSRALALLTLFAVAAPSKPSADPKRRPCKEHPEVAAPCFKVRGRLSLWNGVPSARLWVVGTDRMLGVSDGHALPNFEQMPKNVEDVLKWEVNVFGDFEFCPFTPDEPGVMRLGCIQSGTNLRVEKRDL